MMQIAHSTIYPINTKVKGTESSQDEMVSHIHKNLPVDAIVRLPHIGAAIARAKKRF